jgi:hypothetical protein
MSLVRAGAPRRRRGGKAAWRVRLRLKHHIQRMFVNIIAARRNGLSAIARELEADDVTTDEWARPRFVGSPGPHRWARQTGPLARGRRRYNSCGVSRLRVKRSRGELIPLFPARAICFRSRAVARGRIPRRFSSKGLTTGENDRSPGASERI